MTREETIKLELNREEATRLAILLARDSEQTGASVMLLLDIQRLAHEIGWA